MAIIALIIAELLEYRWHADIVRIRNYHWQQELYELLDAALTGSSASSPADFRAELPLLLCLALPLLALILLLALISWLLGDWIVLPASVLLLLFCFGPADLQSLYHHLRSSDQQQRQQSLRRLLEQARANAAPDSANTTQTLVTAMFLPALQCWFTIIFWFIASALVAGIPAALLLVLLYRSAERRLVPDPRTSPSTSSGDAHQQHWLRQMCWLLEWPAARLMIGLIAIAGDFDLVQAAWREHGDEQDQGKLQHRLLLAIAGRQLDQSVRSSSVGNADAAVAIASAGHALLQRMLMLLSSLLLALAILAWIL